MWAVWDQFSSRCPCSSLHLFSRSIAPLQCLVNVNYRVLICYTCHFQSGSLFFILASSVCKSLQHLICTLTQGGKGGHLFRLTCSVVLWGGRDTANKHHWHVWRVLAVCGPHCICPSSRRCALPEFTAQPPGCSAGALSKAGPVVCALPRSRLLRFSGALPWHRPRCAVCFAPFPGPSHSGDWVLGKCTVPGGLCV